MEHKAGGGNVHADPQRTYSVGEFSSLTGVTVRTLYHYESLGLLHPRRLPNGYRQYGRADVDRMQQVLILRELGMGLADIARNLDVPPAKRRQALRHHLEQLRRQRERLDGIIASVEATLAELDGGSSMSTALDKKSIVKNYRFLAIMIAAMVLGCVFGWLWPKAAAAINPLGKVFINLMFCIVVPLVFASIAGAVATLGSGELKL